jgi:hypothetical protein
MKNNVALVFSSLIAFSLIGFGFFLVFDSFVRIGSDNFIENRIQIKSEKNLGFLISLIGVFILMYFRDILRRRKSKTHSRG